MFEVRGCVCAMTREHRLHSDQDCPEFAVTVQVGGILGSGQSERESD